MRIFIKLYLGTLLFLGANLFSQQKLKGQITDNGRVNINPVFIINISTQKSTVSDISGNFTIDASENDEVRFVKEGYYRFDKKISREDLNSPLNIVLQRMEIQIPEVEVKYKPTGNLAKDSKYLSESGKLKALKSEMTNYMRGPLIEPLPNNTISKTFTGHDFNAGQVSVFGVFNAVSDLFKKATKPKITKADYFETQDFLNRVKQDLNLDFLRKYGMNDEQIDRFLLYANRTRTLAKRFRKDFQNDAVEYELKIAFAEYKKISKLDDW
ncbi:hypothetical protein C1637_24795 [Chryseobacterium lactis]|uniref:Carboxypeptidase-like regulatory domain-containing protein n=1 Tax=Chryseobacterium lactis TaxID=1241981 RepID=A0A3G6RYP3_CHRLC|nr:hypothetical protein [Chryseobacterium lactis]AZA81948.1 hypothetical protein EG342_08515 [Chryseobacterium lactis]AZB06946.1 hypothetical protein EG341_24630 [Chryseobacterium lactis]PNW10996.1 hypothetical protein C1637_24795 [Chryseobacterium lactis]